MNGDRSFSMQTFNFDEWTELYRRDPRAFEAKRQLTLAAELAKAGALGKPIAQRLIDLENRSEGLSNELRAQLAFDAMNVSLRELNQSLDRLKTTLEQVN